MEFWENVFLVWISGYRVALKHLRAFHLGVMRTRETQVARCDHNFFAI